ncbi:hypothetical protein D7B24_002230 [Verticillium nonalfalfae]|uniref:SWI/SNF and RSC complexes subunit ssr4 n=1 Tax=Verticillium nonalfalfae TaxID=1051616 RepID=A0A3M9XY85_9PEZI|nr:uncharacterized protein D7B24_002230 [Verticillium nonalfalfae]RNJ53229.1 hypothetical protein D7B24_002230 [Verticillium nonalfalfae]
MAQQQPIHDPSDAIEDQLLPHVHLISANQYPNQGRLDLQHVTKWLLGAPQVAKDKAPFFWTYLDRPNDGQVLLTWQPLKRLGTNYASDGIVWAPEQYHRQEVGNGLNLEIYYNKTGFAPGDPAAVRARRRFRLVPSQQVNINAPQPDISLWLVHYGQADPQDRLPINMVPFTQDSQTMLNQRNYLQNCGQITRKDFMLSDRGNWPQIAWPRSGGNRQQVYAPIQSRRLPQQMAYPTHQQVMPTGRRGGRQTQAQAAAQAAAQSQAPPPPPGSLAALQLELEDEDLYGDVFDTLTPRDIALSRYQQNHEWMEEVWSSPYSLIHITPPDLGLGLKGELAPLTDGIFSSQGGEAHLENPKKPYVGKLDKGLADEFRKRAQEHIDTTNAEIEKMKADHEAAIAKMKANATILSAEKELRHSVEERGAEFWRLEGQVTDSDEGSSAWSQKHNKKIDDIVAQVEAHLGRQIAVLHGVNRVQAGGYLEPVPEPVKKATPVPVKEATPVALPNVGAESNDMSRRPSHAGSQQSGATGDDADIDMGGTAAGLLDEMHTGLSSTSTPLNFPTPSGLNSGVATPANLGAPSPAPAAASGPGPDVSMANTDANKDAAASSGQDQGSGDWVVVPKGGVSPDTNANTTPAPAPAPAPDAAAAAAATAPTAVAARQGSAVGTPALTEGDNDFSSLGDLDTAGEALAGYDGGLDGGAGSLGDGLDLNMEMEDSAFGDAFHGASNTNTPGENQSEGV